jgi:hypothetical protein
MFLSSLEPLARRAELLRSRVGQRNGSLPLPVQHKGGHEVFRFLTRLASLSRNSALMPSRQH